MSTPHGRRGHDRPGDETATVGFAVRTREKRLFPPETRGFFQPVLDSRQRKRSADWQARADVLSMTLFSSISNYPIVYTTRG